MLKNYFKSEFNKNVLVLLKGTTIAQGLSILISPILSRIYTPEEFGVFALYASIVGIIGVIATGRYELSIVISKSDEEANSLVKLSLKIALFISGALMVLALFLADYFATLLKTPEIKNWLYIVPVSVFLLAFYNTFNLLFTRFKAFNKISNAGIIQSTTTNGLNLGLGVFNNGALGLILGQIIGQLASVVYLFKSNGYSLSTIRKSKMRVGKKYAHFPLKNGLSGFLNILANQLPVLLISSLFGAAIIGFYSLVLKVLNLPMSLIGKSFSQVYYQKIAEIHKNEDDGEFRFVRNTTLKLLALGAIPSIILFLFGEELFSFVYGDEWAFSGQIASLFAFFYLIRFVYFSQSTYLIAKEKLGIELILNSIMFILQIGAIFFGYYFFKDAYLTFLFMAISGGLSYLLFLFVVFNIAKKNA